jgi:hypothetical protein
MNSEIVSSLFVTRPQMWHMGLDARNGVHLCGGLMRKPSGLKRGKGGGSESWGKKIQHDASLVGVGCGRSLRPFQRPWWIASARRLSSGVMQFDCWRSRVEVVVGRVEGWDSGVGPIRTCIYRSFNSIGLDSFA